MFHLHDSLFPNLNKIFLLKVTRLFRRHTNYHLTQLAVVKRENRDEFYTDSPFTRADTALGFTVGNIVHTLEVADIDDP